jgi:ABC-type transporter Mla subunit MlaD
MQIIQTAVPVDLDVAPAPASAAENVVAARANDARAEIDRLMHELHALVGQSVRSGRLAVKAALPAAAKLQVVTANLDACNPSRRPGLAAELVALADQQVRSRRDSIERSLAYTAESTMRRLTEDV